jgi:uncharacterized damage-inducible protein DinB
MNQRIRDTVTSIPGNILASQPAPQRWPLWATIGHLACQRISWLCGFAEEPGAETTPFPNALYNCPGDEDLERVLDAALLAHALDATFAIVDRCLDTWTPPMLEEVIRRRFGDEEWVYTRGSVIQRVFSHDVYHCAEVNELLGRAGVSEIVLWD